MAKAYDRGPAFEKFLDETNRLLADKNFRKVLLEMDAEGEEAIGILAADPAAFLKHRGVKVPADFRLSIAEQLEQTAPGSQTKCYCLRICFWRWCVTICICRIVFSTPIG